MRIPEDFILRLRDSVSIVDTMTPYVSMKAASRDHVCLCPFHSEKTPSCHIYTDTNSFYCFGCGAGGDSITFIRMIENLEYIEAVRFLAQKNGMTVPEDGVSDESANQKMRLLEMNRAAARFFRDMLLSPEGEAGLSYFRSRGLSDSTIKKFGLGYAPNDWQRLKMHMRVNGFSDPELVAASLLVQHANGNTYDKFRNRAMFPIIDLRGNVIGFSGRVMSPDDMPKYLNSSETPVFHKRDNLFALNFAKNSKESSIILCEGNMDVIALHQAGFTGSVATLGTAITGEQVRKLRNYCDEVIIAYDSDAAGQKATMKAMNLLSEAGISARVLELQDAKDPDEYLMKYGKESFLELLQRSGSAISFELKRIERSVDINTPEGKAEYLRRAVELLSDVSRRTDRMIYASEVAKTCELSSQNVEDSVNARAKQKQRGEQREEKKKLIRDVTKRDKINPEEADFPNEAKAERGIIGYIFHSPDYLPHILKQISPSDFPTTFHRNLFEKLILRLKKQQSIDVSSLGSEFSVDEMGRIEQIKRDSMTLPFTRQRLDEYLLILRRMQEDKQKKSPREMDSDELIRYTQKLRENKGNGKV